MAFQFVRFFALSVPTDAKPYEYDGNSNRMCDPGHWSYRTGSKNRSGQLTSGEEVDYRLKEIKECLTRMSGIIGANAPNHLNIFMCPEFYLQGPNGVIGYRDVARFYNGVQTTIQRLDLNNCLIVPGTTIVKSERGTSNYRIYNIIALFYGSNIYVGVKKHTSAVDIINPNRDDFWDCLGRGFIGGKDVSIVGEENSVTEEEFKEVLESIEGSMTFNLMPRAEPYIDVGGIRVGWDICLDHYRRVLRTSGVGECDIQLIPSCGIWPTRESLFLKKHGIFFNVDGKKNRMGSRQREEGTIKFANRELSYEVILGRVGDDPSKSYVEKDQDGTLHYKRCAELKIGAHQEFRFGISKARALLKWSDEIRITSLAP